MAFARVIHVTQDQTWNSDIRMGTSMTAFRTLGRVALLSAALALWHGASRAAAEEVAYLLYLKGTEGKSVPFRVLWDERQDATGRITIDFGAGYEPFLKQLGLPRTAAYDAKLVRGDYVVRDDELARFVKTVVTEIVRPPEQASLLPGTPPAPPLPPPEVKGATLIITPAPDRLRLEVTARLHVTYAPLPKSGPPVVKDFVNGDLIFIGPREPKARNPKSR
jgi:hypothetical protein